jgi:hypothetical protein
MRQQQQPADAAGGEQRVAPPGPADLDGREDQHEQRRPNRKADQRARAEHHQDPADEMGIAVGGGSAQVGVGKHAARTVAA